MLLTEAISVVCIRKGKCIFFPLLTQIIFILIMVTMSAHTHGSVAEIQEFLHVKKILCEILSKNLKILYKALKLSMSVLSNYIFQFIYFHKNFHFPRMAISHCENIPLEECYQCSVLLRVRIDSL